MSYIWGYSVDINNRSIISSVTYGVFLTAAVKNLHCTKAYNAFIGTVLRNQIDSLFIGIM